MMLRVMSLEKIHDGQDVQTFHQQVGVPGERVGARLSSTDRMKIGILMRMMPDELQDAILQHADRLSGVQACGRKRPYT